MTERAGNSIAVKPLTKRSNETGRIYSRRAEVETQIARVLSFDDQQVFELLENRRRESDEYLLDETIVYLLRERKDDDFFVETLYKELNRRIWKLLRGFYKKIDNAADFEDFGQTIEMAVIRNIFNVETDAGYYAQVNFGDYVVQTATFAWYARLRKMDREKEIFEIEHADSDNDTKSDENRFVSTELSPEEKMILQSRLAELPENIRNVAILHYLDGWQIESKEASQPTISNLFNVSSRTIRNWLTQARVILAA